MMSEPWVGPFMVELEFSFTGAIEDAGARYVKVETVGIGFHTIGTVSMGDAAAAASIAVAGPISTDTAPAVITADTRYRASFDTRSGELVGKVWAVATGEPADVSVVCAIDETDDEGDTFTLSLSAVNDGGTQTVRVHSLWMAAQASSGDHVVYEWLGYSSGDTDRFRTRHRYRLGTLVIHVNGIDTTPAWEDGIECRVDAFPTGASGIHATYIAE